MVSANASESDDLFKVGKVAGEFSGIKRVGVAGKIFLRCDFCAATRPFETFLCFESLVGVQIYLMLDKNEAGGVIDEDAPSSVHVVKFGFAGRGE
jgi:hypothetical protein